MSYQRQKSGCWLRQRLNEKVETLSEQKQCLIGMLETAVQPAMQAAEELLKMEDGMDWQRQYMKVMQSLEHNVNAFALIAASAEQLLADAEGVVPPPVKKEESRPVAVTSTEEPASTASSIPQKPPGLQAPVTGETTPAKQPQAGEFYSLTLSNNQMTVNVSHVEPPNHMWVQPYGIGLSELVTQMSEYFKSGVNDCRTVEKPEVGMVCAAQMGPEKSFQRTCIISIQANTSHEVQVLCVDYGNCEFVPLSRLWCLPHRFIALPAQAMPCSLSKVFWTCEANAQVLRLLQSFVLKCLVVDATNRSVPAVCLYMSSKELGHPDTETNLAELLISKGFASPVSVPTPTSGETLVSQTVASSTSRTSKEQEILAADFAQIKPSEGPAKHRCNQAKPLACQQLEFDTTEKIKVAKVPQCSSVQVRGDKLPALRQEAKEVHAEKSTGVLSKGETEARETVELKTEPNTECERQAVNVKTDPNTEGKKQTVYVKTDPNTEGKKQTVNVQKTKPNRECKRHEESVKTVPNTESQNRSVEPLKETAKSFAKKDTKESRAGQQTVKKKQELSGIKPIKFRSSSDSKIDSKRSQTFNVRDTTVENTHASSSQKKSVTIKDTVVYNSKVKPVAEEGGVLKQMGMSSDRGDCAVNFGVCEEFRLLLKKLSRIGFEHPTVFITMINSPSEFFVHCSSDFTSECLQTVGTGLKEYLSELRKENMLAKSSQVELKMGTLCCGLWSEDDLLYRAMVVDVDHSDSKQTKVSVTFLDYGNSEWLPACRLFPLPKQYADLNVIPAAAIRCRLACVIPTVTEDHLNQSIADISDKWNMKANKLFWNLSGFEKRLKMYVVPESSDSTCTGEPADDDDPVPVILVDTTDPEMCVNAKLVEKGVAMFVKPATDAQSDDFNGMDDWEPAVEDYLSERNSYNVEVDDVGVAVMGVKVEDERNICKYFRTKSGCYRGKRCPYRHVAPGDGYTQDVVAVFADVGQEVELPEEGSWVGVEVTAIYSPKRFYITLPWGLTTMSQKSLAEKQLENDSVTVSMELRELVEDMTHHYNRCPFRANRTLLPAIGEIIAARFTADDKWYRAKVTDRLEEDLLKVFYMDFGNCEMVTSHRVREMEPDFLHLPFQAIECSLREVELKPDQNKWSPDDIGCFTELVWDKKLAAFVSRRSLAHLELILYDTERNIVNIAQRLCDAGHGMYIKREKVKKTS